MDMKIDGLLLNPKVYGQQKQIYFPLGGRSSEE